ncbi:unnamed protein product [Ectocarpus sp. 12 AP-2014]
MMQQGSMHKWKAASSQEIGTQNMAKAQFERENCNQHWRNRPQEHRPPCPAQQQTPQKKGKEKVEHFPFQPLQSSVDGHGRSQPGSNSERIEGSKVRTIATATATTFRESDPLLISQVTPPPRLLRGLVWEKRKQVFFVVLPPEQPDCIALRVANVKDHKTR